MKNLLILEKRYEVFSKEIILCAQCALKKWAAGKSMVLLRKCRHKARCEACGAENETAEKV